MTGRKKLNASGLSSVNLEKVHEHRKLIDLDIRNAPGLTRGGVASCAGLSDLFLSTATSITELGKNSLCDSF